MSLERLIWIAFAALAIFEGGQSFAKDLGFRFKNGNCVDEQGRSGLNPAYIGQCSDLSGASVNSLDFEGLDFSGSKFNGADLQSSSFNLATLAAVSFEGAKLTGVTFDRARITGANFKKARLLKTRMIDTVIEETDFTGAEFSGIPLNYLKMKNCILTQANFNGVALSGSEFTGGRADLANFTNADLSEARFQSIRLTSTNFTSVNLREAVFEKVEATGALFDSALLRKTRFAEVDFSGANLHAARFDASLLHRVSLEKANLRATNFTGAKLDAVNFKGAAFNKGSLLLFSKEEAIRLGMIFIPLVCDPKTTVEHDGRCYYLDGSGGTCDAEHALAPQSILTRIAAQFVGKTYKHEVSDNCCVYHSQFEIEGEDYGMSSECNSNGPFTAGPVFGAAGCRNIKYKRPKQLTLCMSVD